MTAIIYARFSTERQNETSITDQLRICREHADARGWTVESEHADEGISGAALGNRPGVQAALAALRAGSVLLVSDLSRLSRSQDLAPLLSRLRHRGARIVGVQDGFDSEARTARMQAGLSGIMSEEFRAMVADRTRSALAHRAREGRPTGGKAYDDPGIIREVFVRFAGGEAMRAICSDLNRRGIPSPGAGWKSRNGTRGKWLVSALRAILTNERYIGRLVWNRSQWVKDPDTGKRHRRERPESEWIVRDCEALIDRPTWDRVQARFRKISTGARGSYLLSGLLVCGCCGSRMIVVGGSQHRYACGTRHAGGEHACANGMTVPRKAAEAVILSPVVQQMLSPKAVTEGVRMMREAAKEARAPVDAEVAELERLVREGLVSAELIAPSLTAARERAEARRSGQVMPFPTEKAWRDAVAQMREILTGDDVAAAREVLRDLIGTVEVCPCDGGLMAAVASELRYTGTNPAPATISYTYLFIPSSVR